MRKEISGLALQKAFQSMVSQINLRDSVLELVQDEENCWSINGCCNRNNDLEVYQEASIALVSKKERIKQPLGGRMVTRERQKYSVCVYRPTHGSYWEPPDVQEIEIASAPTLLAAIKAYIMATVEEVLNNIRESAEMQFDYEQDKELEYI